MKLHVSLLRLPLALLALLAAATSVRALTTYYVHDSGGSDSYDGSAPTHGAGSVGPFKTINKATSMLTPNGGTYKIVIRDGTYPETVTLPPNVSTSSGNSVTFEAYLVTTATPNYYENVTITGADLIPDTAWASDTQSGVWKMTDATLPNGTAPSSWNENTVWGDLMQVFQNNVMKPTARWPNVGTSFPFLNNTVPHTNSDLGDINKDRDWSYVDSVGTSGSVMTLTDAQLAAAFPSGTGFLTGGGRVFSVSGDGWIMTVMNITAASGGTLTTSQATTATSYYKLKAGNEYYVAGKKELLDAVGEWFYDSAVHTLYYYNGASAPTNVSVKRRNFAFDIAGRSYVTIQWMKLHACTIKTYDKAGQYELMTNLANRCSYKHLTMTYPQHMETPPPGTTDPKLWSQHLYNVSGLVLGPYCTLSDSNLSYASNRMVAIMGKGVTITKNNLHHSGYVPNWCALVEATFWNDTANGDLRAEQAYISQNTLSDTGRAAIGYPGRAALVQYNDISKAMRLTTDGAAIYWGQWEASNSIFKYNRIHDCTSPWGHTGVTIRGFYPDSLNGGWFFHHNIIWNIIGYNSSGVDAGGAIQINARSNYGRVFNNTCYNCNGGLLFTSWFGDGPTNMKIYNNIFYNPTGPTFNSATFDLWGFSDLRNNLFGDPSFFDITTNPPVFRLKSTSLAKDQGLDIPGVNSGTNPAPAIPPSGAPDMGALEYVTSGLNDWISLVGSSASTLTTNTYAAHYEYAGTGSADPAYPNLVQDGSFELSPVGTGALSSAWSVSGSGVAANYSNAWTAPNDARTGFYSAKFSPGPTTIWQTVSNLKPGKRYKFTCGVMNTSYPSSTVTLTVSGAGYSDYTGQMTTDTGAYIWATAPTNKNPMMVELPFINGAGTTATVKVTANVATGNFVYVDDLAVVLAEDNTDPEPYAMPKAAYSFDESASPAYGTTLPPSNYPLTLTGATLTSGKSGNALTLTSVTNKAEAASVAVPASGADKSFTLSFWWKPADALSGRTIASNNDFQDHSVPTPPPWTVNNAVGWAMQAIAFNSAPGIRFSLCNGDGSTNDYQFFDFKNLSTSRFWHIAVTVDRSKKLVMTYIDGRLNSISALKSPLFDNVDFGDPATTFLRFGSNHSEAAAGQIDDFQAWDSVLPGEQIDNIYLAGDPVASGWAVPVHRLKFDEATNATTMWDASGNKHHATITSGSGAALVAGGKISNLGNALAFNGATGNSAATVAGGTGGLKVPADSTKSFAVAFWINLNGFIPSATDKIATNDDQVWIHKGWAATLTTTSRMRFYLKSGSEPSNPGPSQYAQSGVLTGSGWQHAVIVVTQSAGTGCTITTYLDGVVSGTPYSNAATIDTSTTNALRLGGGGCKATIDDFRLYQWDSASEAMTAQEVLDLYKQLDRPPY